MPKTVAITCDSCSRDLTTTGNSIGYRIVLASEAIPSRGGIVTDMAAYPFSDEPMYFCNGNCLHQWAKDWVEKIAAQRGAPTATKTDA